MIVCSGRLVSGFPIRKTTDTKYELWMADEYDRWTMCGFYNLAEHAVSQAKYLFGGYENKYVQYIVKEIEIRSQGKSKS